MSHLSFKDAIASPCSNCQQTCCTMLPLHDFWFTTLMDVDYALYLSNFEHIEFCLVQGQKWRVHYRMACSNLSSGKCILHGTPQKPMVCQEYNPYQCFYKHIFEGEENPEFLRFDSNRLRAYVDLLTFNEDRQIVGYPDYKGLISILPKLNFSELPVPHSETEHSKSSESVLTPSIGLSEEIIKDAPCSGCQAWCCTKLMFPHGAPTGIKNIDHLRFLLGFPGVSLGYSPEGWTVTVSTTCKHLERLPSGAGVCGIFNSPLRPITCQQYNAVNCAYRYRYGDVEPPHYVRVNRDSFDKIAKLYKYDTHGSITTTPTFEEIRLNATA